MNSSSMLHFFTQTVTRRYGHCLCVLHNAGKSTQAERSLERTNDSTAWRYHFYSAESILFFWHCFYPNLWHSSHIPLFLQWKFLLFHHLRQKPLGMKNSIVFDHFYGVIRIYATIKIMSIAPNYYTFSEMVSCFVPETAEEEKETSKDLLFTTIETACVCAACQMLHNTPPLSLNYQIKRHRWRNVLWFHDLLTRSKEANVKCILCCVAFMLNVEPGGRSRYSVCDVNFCSIKWGLNWPR